MQEGTVNAWLIAEGDSFAAGDEICEIETSKIANVVEAPFDGTLRKILAQPGETLPVGAPIAVSAEGDTDEVAISTFLNELAGGQGANEAPNEVLVAGAAAAPTSAAATLEPISSASAVTSAGTEIPSALTSGADDSAIKATLHGRKFAQQHGVNLNQVTATGRGGRVTRTDVENAILAAGGSLGTQGMDDASVAATPLARRLAQQQGVNLGDCNNSGSAGKVTKADVLALSQAPANANAEVVPMTAMRRTIAQRLQAAKQEMPHFRVVVDVELDNLLALRKKINGINSGAKLSVNDFVIKACASALSKVPDVNVQFDEASQSILRFADADISVAVAMPDGLITPIVKQANRKGLSEISNEMRHLATKAKAKTLQPDEFQGGTFTISNLGMFGVKQFDAIVNPPQCAILAVGAGEARPVIKDGELSKATVMTLSLSSDHRVIDGSVAASFMQELKNFLEHPALMIA
jgi:pyruvate dehydrogenase E2 component (dihydrolipoamide acetyltransferase)